VGALELRGAPENILVHRLPVGGTSVVEVVYKLTSSTRDSRSRIAFFDARGSEVATAPLSTTTANVAEAWDFDAWGKSTLLTTTAPRYGFVGFEPDVAFGTYAFGRRVYDPSLRRWLSPDTLAAVDPEAVTVAELDLWGYAGANPVKHVDPAGTCISDSCFDRQAKSVEGMSTSEKAGLAGAMGGAVLAGIVAPIVIEALAGVVARLAMSPTTPEVIIGALEGEAGLATTSVVTTAGAVADDATRAVSRLAKEVADTAQSARPRPGTVAVLETPQGLFSGTSGSGDPLHPKVKQALDAIPAEARSKFHGNCAEPQCITKALNAGAETAGGKMTAVRVRRPDHPAHGTKIPPCASCAKLQEEFGIK
jgi:RHS repeat-associated protein